MNQSSPGTGDSQLPLQYEDGPDYCTVKDAQGRDFALTMQPELMKAMERALREDIAELSRPPAREAMARTIQQFWQGPSGRPWDGTDDSCCVKLPPQAEWFRRLADVVLAEAGSVAQSPAAPAEAMNLIDVRLADLREANEIFRKSSWDRSSDILRNDREIRWLIDFRTLLIPTCSVSSTEGNTP